jgi:hypothetical protein
VADKATALAVTCTRYRTTRGDVGQHREPHYSRGIRQRLRKMSQHHKWKELYNVSINDMSSFMNDYSDMMARSLFCLVAPGAHGLTGPATCLHATMLPWRIDACAVLSLLWLEGCQHMPACCP